MHALFQVRVYPNGDVLYSIRVTFAQTCYLSFNNWDHEFFEDF